MSLKTETNIVSKNIVENLMKMIDQPLKKSPNSPILLSYN